MDLKTQTNKQDLESQINLLTKQLNDSENSYIVLFDEKKSKFKPS